MGRGALACGRKGFTLVEVTVAMGILSFILLGLAAMAGISARGGVLSKQRTRATYLATQMLENLCDGNITEAMLLNYDNDNTADPSTYFLDPASKTGEWANSISTQLQQDAFGTIDVARVDASPDRITNRYRVTVTVTWFNRGQRNSVTIVGVR